MTLRQKNTKDFSITNDTDSSKIYAKRDDFNFEVVNFQYLDGYVPRPPSYAVYISQLICFATICYHVSDFNNRNQSLTAKLLNKVADVVKFVKCFQNLSKTLKVDC